MALWYLEPKIQITLEAMLIFALTSNISEIMTSYTGTKEHIFAMTKRPQATEA